MTLVPLCLIVVSLIGWIGNVGADECLSSCDDNVAAQATTSVTFCGTDMLTHSTSFEAMDTDHCYATCGLMAQYEGICGCPNDCLSSVKQGSCDTSSLVCVCAPGWGGEDCSLPTVENSCSFHGKLILAGSSDSKFPNFDYCSCDANWTGTDCSTPVFTGGNLPWGELYPETPSQYSSSDKYGDDHPLFDISKLATIRVTLDAKDFRTLLLPANLYNESYASATMSFDNGGVQETLFNVGFRIKGAYSRLDEKKGWVIKFDEFVDGQHLLDTKKIGLKSGSVADDTLLKTKLYNDLYRAMNAPTQRSSFALLYINNQFAGVYYLHEDIGKDFLQSRNLVDVSPTDDKVVDAGKGNLYKFFWNVHLGYFGPDEDYYRTKAHINELGVPMYYYEQAEGDNTSWQDFLDMLLYLNTSDYTPCVYSKAQANVNGVHACNDDSFYNTITDHFEVQTLLRGSVVECFMLGSDNMASGANYYLYHHAFETNGATASSPNSKTPTDTWVLFDADFDECLAFDPVTGETDRESDILAFFVTDPKTDSFDDVNPLMNGLLASPTSPFRAQYLKYYGDMLQRIFQLNPTSLEMKSRGAASVLPQERYSQMMQFLLPWVQRDRLWQFSFNMTTEKFAQDAEQSIAFLPQRALNTWSQVLNYTAN